MGWELREIRKEQGTYLISLCPDLKSVKSFVIDGNLGRRLEPSRGFDGIIISSSVFTNMMIILFDLR